MGGVVKSLIGGSTPSVQAPVTPDDTANQAEEEAALKALKARQTKAVGYIATRTGAGIDQTTTLSASKVLGF